MTLRTSSTQISNACCDLCPLEKTLKSAVEVTEVSASDFLLLPSSDLLRDPPSSDSGTFPATLINTFQYLTTEKPLKIEPMRTDTHMTSFLTHPYLVEYLIRQLSPHLIEIQRGLEPFVHAAL